MNRESHHLMGFTLVEILVVATILVLLSVLALTSFSNFGERAALDQAKEEINLLLNQARSMTLDSKSADVYGVHFEESKVVRFRGSSYSSSDPENVVFNLDSRVRVADVAISGDNEVIFKRLTGATDNTGFIFMEVIADNSLRATTTILSSGIIE